MRQAESRRLLSLWRLRLSSVPRPNLHHEFRRVSSQHVAWIFLRPKPTRVIFPAQYRRHAIVISCDRGIGLNGHCRERPLPFARRGIAPVFPNARDTEQRAILDAKRMGLALPIMHIKVIHRYDAAAAAIRVAEDVL